MNFSNLLQQKLYIKSGLENKNSEYTRRKFLKAVSALSPGIILGLHLKTQAVSSKKLFSPKKIRPSNHLLVVGNTLNGSEGFIVSGLLRFCKNAGIKSIPFKPISIDKLPTGKKVEITPSILIQSIAAGIEPLPCMNPIRSIYKSSAINLPELYINGIKQSNPIKKLSNTKEMMKYLDVSLKKIMSLKRLIIVETSGILTNWIGSATLATIIDRINPRILFVVDTPGDNGLAEVVGTFELLPLELRVRVEYVLFNRFDVNFRFEPFSSWEKYLMKNYRVRIIGCLPPIQGIKSISKNVFPIDSKNTINSDLDILFKIIKNCIDPVFLSSLRNNPQNDNFMKEA